MVTTSNGHGGPVSLPELPSAGSIAQSAQRANSVSDTPTETTERDQRRVPRSALRVASAALTGGSLLHTQPPSIATLWAWHRDCASHYEALLVSGPRRLWGVLHVACCAVFYGLAWVLTSPPLFFCAAGVVAACVIWA
jgi:hypothetical protein